MSTLAFILQRYKILFKRSPELKFYTKIFIFALLEIKRQFLYSIILFLSANAAAQETVNNYRLPIDGAVSLSANYGPLP
jgi:hypothetical protein